IGTSSPVLGFLPMRSPFCRTEKLPKDEIFTDSPRINASQTSSITSFTCCADSLRERPTSSYTASAKSARVIVFFAIYFISLFLSQPIGLYPHHLRAYCPG